MAATFTIDAEIIAEMQSAVASILRHDEYMRTSSADSYDMEGVSGGINDDDDDDDDDYDREDQRLDAIDTRNLREERESRQQRIAHYTRCVAQDLPLFPPVEGDDDESL